jgi:hypothetical protein
MDSERSNFRYFLYPFSFKNPLIYIILCVSVFLYIYLFFVRHDDEYFGVIERSKETKIFFVFFVSTVFFFALRNFHFFHQIESIFLRGILLFGFVALAVVFVLPAWKFNKYDYKKLDTYTRLLPFKTSPYIKTGETLIFKNIKTIKYRSGGDSGSALRLLLNNGKRQSLELGSISNKSKNIFLVTLYDQCVWLRDGIENQFGSIDRRKMYINEKTENYRFSAVHAVFFIFFILSIFVEIISVITAVWNNVK